MDCITIKNLKFHSLHGFYPEEQTKGNDFEIDIVFWVSLEAAAKKDDLARTIDYSETAGIVHNIMNGESVKLIETLLYAIGESLLHAYPAAEKIEVAIRKINPSLLSSCEYAEVKSQWPKL
ncbi:MAG: dihydroneopterin aldolase [Balneolales bacterium]